MKDLVKRQETLINLITRVGGKQNIQKWMDELLKIDWKLEKTVGNKMFKINVWELNPSIQKKLSNLVEGKLVKGVITTPVDPDSLDWEELEIKIYGDIDSDSDRLFECVSWGDEQEQEVDKVDPLRVAIEANLASIEDLEKYLVNGADFALFNNRTLIGAVGSYTYGLDIKYCGETFTATGKTKQVTEYEQMSGFGFTDSISERTFTQHQYQHQDGATVWAGKKFKSLPTQEEIVRDLQTLTWEYCKRNNITWIQLAAAVESRKARNEQERLDKIAAEEAAKSNIPEPQWFREEVKNKFLKRFWVGDDYVYSFWWNEKDGTVWQECDDRTRGFSSRTRETKSLGSNQETILDYIKGLYAQREEINKKAVQQAADYEAYKKTQQAKKGLVKSFEKWLASA